MAAPPSYPTPATASSSTSNNTALVIAVIIVLAVAALLAFVVAADVDTTVDDGAPDTTPVDLGAMGGGVEDFVVTYR